MAQWCLPTHLSELNFYLMICCLKVAKWLPHLILSWLIQKQENNDKERELSLEAFHFYLGETNLAQKFPRRFPSTSDWLYLGHKTISSFREDQKHACLVYLPFSGRLVLLVRKMGEKEMAIGTVSGICHIKHTIHILLYHILLSTLYMLITAQA